MASELEVGKIGIGLAGVSPARSLHINDTSEPDILLTRTAGVADSTSLLGNIYFGNQDTDKYLCAISAIQDGAKASGRLEFATDPDGSSRTTRLTLDSAGLATFSGNTEHGGADGVQTFYAHGIAGCNTTWYVDVPCDSDAGIATVFKVEASFSHCNCGFSAILETWTATRATSATSYEVKREDSSDAGVWSVSKTSNTNFRVTHTAGSSGGTGPYWVKVTHRNA